METRIEQLVALSRFYGADPEMVLAGGGNTSVKEEGRLWVKASGFPLAAIGPDGFVELERAVLDALLSGEPLADEAEREARFKAAIMAARAHPERGQRPSVEAALHHLMPFRFVVHTHATLANALTCCSRGEEIVRAEFGDGVLWIPYVDPGDALARLVRSRLEEYADRTGNPAPPALLLQNHGLIVGGDTPEAVRRTTDELLARVADILRQAPPAERFRPVARLGAADARALVNVLGPALRYLLAEDAGPKIVTFDDSDVALRLAASADGPALAAGGPLTPDQIVYCTSYPLDFAPRDGEGAAEIVERLREGARRHAVEHGCPPKVVLVRGLGLFAVGLDAAAADTVRLVYKEAIRVMAAAERLGGIRFMDQRDRAFIEGWEVENFRRAVAAGEGAVGRVTGKVAVVTGAARGFGAGIAASLIAEGAHVIVADVRIEEAARVAEALCAGHGPCRAVAVPMDVADEDSVDDAIHHTIRAMGGLDILVSNAGILRAGGVKEQAVSDFEAVLRVNTVGYFLCARAAARVFAIQHLASPEAWFDIVQINSKSGLEGSNRNGAYAASKFAGVGLTQSLALELLADRVKVNAICPGNFFEGPLWSDPDDGLFVQYLRTGKAPGAITVEDVRRFYESRVPMGRGCRVSDVMTALFYLLEQEYETGQALPVTGGQIMMN